MPRLYGFEDMAFRRVRESEAEGARAAASRRLLKQSFNAITEWMNAEGYRTTRGGRWRPDGVANMLDHPAIAGLAEDENGNLVETGCPAIISREDFVAIRAMRRTSDPEKQRVEQRDYMVPSHITACGLCGTPLGSSPSNSGSRGYRCSPSTAQHPGGCGRVRINADLLETYLAELVLAELAKPGVSALIDQARDEMLAQAAGLRKEAAAARRRQKKLGEDYARLPDMSLKAFRTADMELKQLISEREVRARFLEQVKHVPVGAIPDLVRWWKHAPLQAKRGVLTLMLEQVVLYPAASRGSRTVNADRVALQWRQWGESAAEMAVGLEADC
ncbi:recombinase family protein [Streptomyces sp. BP-8]|uniref:Recombinase family protein n=1 Tax=Streptomyces sirii TaxID=3127701 RepID=A0ABZ2QLS7_9ACTN